MEGSVSRGEDDEDEEEWRRQGDRERQGRKEKQRKMRRGIWMVRMAQRVALHGWTCYPLR